MQGVRRIYLAGLSGAGKSSVAERLAAWLGWQVLDVDREVERRTGRPLARLWAEEGEAAFRRAEGAAIERLTARDAPCVAALGGGALEDASSRERLAAWGVGVFLDAPAETLASRVVGAGAERPFLAGKPPVEALRELASARAHGFASLPHRVDADGRSIEAVAVDVLRAVPDAFGAAEPARVADSVCLGRDALRLAGSLLAGVLPASPRGAIVVATDGRVWSLHGSALAAGLAEAGWEARPCMIPESEAAKTPVVAADLWRAFAGAGADRDAPVAALGGGATSDVAGLAAATFKRGLPLALFPTTLLAQVDAAIGGKNGVNFAGVKNLIGTFHFPTLVAIDPLCVLTLPDRDWLSGWAEIVKTGAIGDPAILDLCEREAGALRARRLDVVEEGIRRAVRVKAAIVDDDPREGGPRGVLNLGHTLGHAIEAAAGGRVKHGEAISMGIVAAARLGEEMGISDSNYAARLASILGSIGLPIRMPEGMRSAPLLSAIGQDKKRRAGALRVALPVRPGHVLLREIEPATLRGWVEKACGEGHG